MSATRRGAIAAALHASRPQERYAIADPMDCPLCRPESEVIEAAVSVWERDNLPAAVAEFDRVVQAVRLELPVAVWDSVAEHWGALRAALSPHPETETT